MNTSDKYHDRPKGKKIVLSQHLLPLRTRTEKHEHKITKALPLTKSSVQEKSLANDNEYSWIQVGLKAINHQYNPTTDFRHLDLLWP